MCARLRLIYQAEKLLALFNNLRIAMMPPPNPNAAPTDAALILANKGDEIVGFPAHFGLVPFWAKDKKIAASLINARTETVQEKPAFREAYQRRHCLIPASGFYEWRTENGARQPYLFSRRDGEPIMLAGLWEKWIKEENPLFSFTILTADPTPLIAPFHDRMPIALPRERWSEWLDPAQSTLSTLTPLPDDCFAIRPVNAAVNNPREKSLEAIDQAA